MLTVKGERHTGTTFFQSLLRHHFPEQTREIVGWHFHEGCKQDEQPRVRGADDLFVCCSKHGALDDRCSYPQPPPIFVLSLHNPYSWLSANFFVPYGGCANSHLDNFSAWLRSSSTTYGSCKPWRVRSSPIAVWREQALSYNRWAAQHPTSTVLIRDSEAFAEDRLLARLAALGRMLKLPPRNYTLPPQLPPLRAGQKPWTPSSFNSMCLKYRRRPWRKMYSADDLRYVNSQLSDEALAGFERVHQGCTPAGEQPCPTCMPCLSAQALAKGLAKGVKGSERKAPSMHPGKAALLAKRRGRSAARAAG